METHRKLFISSAWCLLLLGVILRFSLLGHLAISSEFWLIKEIGLIVFSVGVFMLVSRLPSKFLQTWDRPLILVGIIFLFLMHFGLAHEIKGAARWIRFEGFNFQPAELIKVLTIVYLAGFLSRHRDHLKNFWRGFFPALFLLALIFLLILKQPDFGTSVLLIMAGLWMMLIGGARWRHLFCVSVIVIPVLTWLIISSPYRLERFQTWLQPNMDLQGKGYQINQAKWALREGGWTGKGLLQGHSRHGYLPESTSDFIGAVWIEETGLIGFVGLLGLFGVLVFQILRTASLCSDRFDRLLCAGVGVLFGGQILFNLGVVTGLLPTKGIPLPLISSGGTSLMATACLLGLVWRIMNKEEEICEAQSEPNEGKQIWNGL